MSDDITITATAELTITIDADSLEDIGWYEYFNQHTDLNDFKDEFELEVA